MKVLAEISLLDFVSGFEISSGSSHCNKEIDWLKKIYGKWLGNTNQTTHSMYYNR